MSRFRVNFRLKLLILLTVCLRDRYGVDRDEITRERETNEHTFRDIAVC